MGKEQLRSGINTTLQLFGAKLCSPKHHGAFCLPQSISPKFNRNVIFVAGSSSKF